MSPTPPQLAEVIRDLVRQQASPMTTHSESCWQWHLPCAAILAAMYIDAVEEDNAD